MDDPVTERVRKNTQVVSDAAYKGVHPHIVEMDRRPGIIVGELANWHLGRDLCNLPLLCTLADTLHLVSA